MKPKILHIIPSFNSGGVELGIRTMCERGFYDPFDTFIIGMHQGEGNLHSYFSSKLGEGHVRYISDAIQTPSHRDLPNLFYQIFREIARLKPDVVIISSNRLSNLGRLAAFFFPSLKIITYEHTGRASTPLPRLFFKLSSMRCEAVFADSPETLRIRRSHYMAPIPGLVVPMTILEPQVSLCPLRIPTTFKLLTIGRLSPEKNYSELVHAMAILRDEGRSCELTIIGEGQNRPLLEKLIKDYNLEDHITLTGFIADKAELQSWRARSDIYVQPSLYEGFCLATAEAMAAGMVVATTDFAGIRDYGIEGTNRIAIKGFSASDIAAALSDTMTHYAEIADNLSRGALQTTREIFSDDSVKGKWMEAQDYIRRLVPAQPCRPAAS